MFLRQNICYIWFICFINFWEEIRKRLKFEKQKRNTTLLLNVTLVLNWFTRVWKLILSHWGTYMVTFYISIFLDSNVYLFLLMELQTKVPNWLMSLTNVAVLAQVFVFVLHRKKALLWSSMLKCNLVRLFFLFWHNLNITTWHLGTYMDMIYPCIYLLLWCEFNVCLWYLQVCMGAHCMMLTFFY